MVTTSLATSNNRNRLNGGLLLKPIDHAVKVDTIDKARQSQRSTKPSINESQWQKSLRNQLHEAAHEAIVYGLGRLSPR